MGKKAGNSDNVNSVELAQSLTFSLPHLDPFPRLGAFKDSFAKAHYEVTVFGCGVQRTLSGSMDDIVINRSIKHLESIWKSFVMT